MNNKIRFLILLIAIALIWYLGRFFNIDPEAIRVSLKKFSYFQAGLVYILLYCVVTFFILFSKDIFRLTGAVLFGAIFSTLLIWIAEIINALILFNLARLLGRAFVEDSLRGKYSKLDERLRGLNFLWLFLFRTVPFIPFRFLDLAGGLAGVPFRRYLLVVILGSPLRIFWLQYILAGVGTAIFKKPGVLVEYLMLNKGVFIFSSIYFILIIVVIIKMRSRD